MMAPAQKAQTTDEPNYQGRSQTVNKQIKENECTNLPRQITSKHVSEGITLAMKGTQENEDNPAILSNETWETQARKSRNKGRVKNKPIVGNKTKCSLKAATQKTFLHVYKLDVSMKPQDVNVNKRGHKTGTDQGADALTPEPSGRPSTAPRNFIRRDAAFYYNPSPLLVCVSVLACYKYSFQIFCEGLNTMLADDDAAQRLVPPRKYHSDDDEDHADYNEEVEEEDFVQTNSTDEKGLYVGAPCEFTCSAKLVHVYCNPVSGTCDCEKKYPVKLNNPYAGCSKPKRLGDQCYYKETCQYTDQHSSCIQIHHNAICQCENGYHSVSIQKPSKRVFCAEDVVVITSNFSTFAGVLSGIAILSGLICFVLHLFNQNLYGSHRRRHRFGNANLAPPIMFSSDPGSRRPSIASVHSMNSIRSYSARRYDRERQQKEEREMERRYSKMSGTNTNSTMRIGPTPSPHSTDDLLPTLEEDKQIPPLAAKEDSTTSFPEEMPSTSKQYP
ncbi:hypothetical protein JTB14_026282 [Gonioctena quinquepunctata]|nr:hypothetical protein JTB14_026282 [Gonioctena quinquepunctata]